MTIVALRLIAEKLANLGQSKCLCYLGNDYLGQHRHGPTVKLVHPGGRKEGHQRMNATIYPTILTGLGVIITLIVTMHNLAKTNQQETNRRIDDLKIDLKELLDARFKVIDSQFEVVNIRFQKLEGNIADIRHEVQEIKRVIFKPAA